MSPDERKRRMRELLGAQKAIPDEIKRIEQSAAETRRIIEAEIASVRAAALKANDETEQAIASARSLRAELEVKSQKLSAVAENARDIAGAVTALKEAIAAHFGVMGSSGILSLKGCQSSLVSTKNLPLATQSGGVGLDWFDDIKSHRKKREESELFALGLFD